MKITNKFGLEVTLKELWDDTGMKGPGMDKVSLKDLLMMKAHNVYCDRMAEAVERGASEAEMDTIDATDVKLNVWDIIENILTEFRVYLFVREIIWFRTTEPDYDYLYYGGA